MADNVTQQTAMPNGTAKMSQIPELCPHAELNVRPGMLQSPLTNRTPTTKPKTKLTIALNVVDTCMTPNAGLGCTTGQLDLISTNARSSRIVREHQIHIYPEARIQA